MLWKPAAFEPIEGSGNAVDKFGLTGITVEPHEQADACTAWMESRPDNRDDMQEWFESRPDMGDACGELGSARMGMGGRMFGRGGPAAAIQRAADAITMSCGAFPRTPKEAKTP